MSTPEPESAHTRRSRRQATELQSAPAVEVAPAITRRSRRDARISDNSAVPAPSAAPAPWVAENASVLASEVPAASEGKPVAPAVADKPQPAATKVERNVLDDAVTEHDETLVDAAVDVDPFAEAAKLFSFTGEVPAVRIADNPVTPETEIPVVALTVPARRRGASFFKRAVTASASLGVVGAVGVLALSMGLPAAPVAASVDDVATTNLTVAGSAANDADTSDADIQAFVVPSDVSNAEVQRSESYESASVAQVAADEGIRYSDSVFTNDPTASIQWPFAVGVSMSSGYGIRWGRLHEGIDFTPGEGAPIQAIADGTVRIATESGGAYGVTVYIDHVIDGEVVTSHYAHMQYGSLQVKAGQQVKVGDIIGHTGNTGRSYGAHLHFEIIINGHTIDPLPWLREHAGT